ncbi:hypothetical protein L202_05427 [Cryptococcus amylolentus CBS 6039]|uniref:Cytochrome P450 n=2 Tax=Cryptococcus amylolentus CBS 6039 TaxID=1295533 RepID=A0A1E3HKH0_9TREE|nr:hypothetical protein L202_05427 [Cryptococcus amylolentus CBS 6039]ODN76830.1 hypothetical protein L202_05427 [Cryptococcus amylolentus CBS 6039]
MDTLASPAYPFATMPRFFILPSVLTVLYSLVAVSLLSAGLYIYLYPYRLFRLSFRNLPGPEPGHWFWGHTQTLIAQQPNAMHTVWTNKHGPTIRYPIFLGIQRFLTIDPSALNYILTHPESFEKPSETRGELTTMLGNGLLVAEGSDHKKQRKALGPSFSPAAIRGMIPAFYDKAYESNNKLMGLVEGADTEVASPTPAKDIDFVPGGKKIDVMSYLSKTALDIIGTCGFAYDFKALSEPSNELSDAYRNMFMAVMDVRVWDFIVSKIPIIRSFPTKRSKVVAASKKLTRSIGMSLLREKKDIVMGAHGGDLEKKADIGKDLISILVKANMAAGLKPEQRLSDEEVLDQITTFMLAGNETTSTGLTWILYNLSQNQDVQEKLRQEVQSVSEDRPSLDTLNTLPYMEAVVHESLRISPPASFTLREATQDAILPLANPVTGNDGKVMHEVAIDKGTSIFIPVITVNTSPSIWGDDAAKFIPERWLSSSKDGFQPGPVPGVWGNTLTFLGGGRNCIGYRFALAEIKVILFVLMRSLMFEELKSKPVISKKTGIVMRCSIEGEEEAGLQMPLMVRPVAA